MEEIPIVGYADRFSLKSGEKISFKVSCTSTKPYSAKLIRVISGDPNPEGPGLIEEDVKADFAKLYESRYQATDLGSYIRVPSHPTFDDLTGFTIGATIWPTTPDKPDQCIISRFSSDRKAGIAIFIGPDGTSVITADGTGSFTKLTINRPLAEQRWYHVWASFDPKLQTLKINQIPVVDSIDLDSASFKKEMNSVTPKSKFGQPFIISATGDQEISGHFNGKIERPFLLTGVLPDSEILDIAKGSNSPHVVAIWDFSKNQSTQEAVDIGPNKIHGTIVNLPTRAMKGFSWDGTCFDWTKKPEHYAAIHFHDDDLYDCGWETDFTFQVPKTFKSGVYAAKLQTEDQIQEMIPFFVTAPLSGPQARICILIPTFTYTVYANIARGNTNAEMRERVKQWGAQTWTADDHPEYGLSTYNYHTDGSGIGYSSRRRPIITMRSNVISYPGVPGSGCRHFPADSHLWYWLEKKGYDFDVITDDELHEYGVDAINCYDVVMTCSHPEYHTSNSLNAIQEYTHQGGHLLYLGGNGFYWKVAIAEAWPDAIEIRRGEGGIRAWASEPGEYYNAFDGSYGGLWRRNGRAPQVLSGVGFTSQGDHFGAPYRRTVESYNTDVSWIFDDILDEVIGDFGLSGGGAAGFELDRADVRLGTPLNSIIVASSEGHDNSFVLVPEDILTHHDTWPHEPLEDLIRADIVYFDTPNGGAVFSVGSITFCGSLPENECNNNISTMIDNVVRKFLSN
jgi:N,N-dimethylformamidase